jgi:FAD synthetase
LRLCNRTSWHNANSMRVLTFGTFDDLHPGHRAYLKQAAKRGDLFVIVARDQNVLRIKGRAPLHDEHRRMEAIKKAFPKATVMLGNDTGDFLDPVRGLKPDLIVLGYDQKLPPGMEEGHLPCPIERAKPFKPEVHKSSIRRGNK